MAAANSQLFPAQDAQADAVIQEPSMEDILASIRRIIASDQTVANARNLSPVVQTSTGPDQAGSGATTADDPIDPPPALASREGSVTPGSSGFPGLEDLEPLVLPPSPVESEAAPPSAEPDAIGAVSLAALQERLFPPEGPDVAAAAVYDLSPDDRLSADEPEPLISSSAGASVSSSFQALANSVLMRDPEMLDRIAREALRPMLKTWLDENLPSMVERLVRAEIERVARGGR